VTQRLLQQLIHLCRILFEKTFRTENVEWYMKSIFYNVLTDFLFISIVESGYLKLCRLDLNSHIQRLELI